MDLDTLQLGAPRLLLRPTRREDFDAWAAFMADAESARCRRRAAAPGRLARIPDDGGRWAIQGFAMFSVIEKATGLWVGRIGPWQPEGWPGTEVGWGIVRDRCGPGYATEAATATIDWVFAELGWTEVVHTIDVDNVTSQAVARKLGLAQSRPRPIARAIRGDVIDIWAQTKEDWLSRAGARAKSSR